MQSGTNLKVSFSSVFSAHIDCIAKFATCLVTSRYFIIFSLPTTIEDIYRKEERITLYDEDTIKRIKQSLVDHENDNEV